MIKSTEYQNANQIEEIRKLKVEITNQKEEITNQKEKITSQKEEIQKLNDEIIKLKEETKNQKEEAKSQKEEIQKLNDEIIKLKEESAKAKESNIKQNEIFGLELNALKDHIKTIIQNELLEEQTFKALYKLDPDNQKYNFTELHFAAKINFKGIGEVLISKGVDIEAKDMIILKKTFSFFL